MKSTFALMNQIASVTHQEISELQLSICWCVEQRWRIGFGYPMVEQKYQNLGHLFD